MNLLSAFPQLRRANLANALTAIGAIAGVGAMLAAARDRPRVALLLLAIAILMDKLDGMVARRLGQQSDFGRELDSLADAVSFCVAPALLTVLRVHGAASAVAGMLFVAAGIWRLAYYNLTGLSGSGDDERFTGVPTTIAASWYLILAALLSHAPGSTTAVVLPLAHLALALAMVSAIRFPKHGLWVNSLYVAIPAALAIAFIP